MDNHNYEMELKRLYKLVRDLAKEIDYKNYRLSEMHIEQEQTNASFRKTAIALTEELNNKDRDLSELKRMYQESSAAVRSLMDEKIMLQSEYTKEIKNLKCELECQRKQNLQLTNELWESKNQNRQNQKKLVYEIKQLKENSAPQSLHNTMGNLNAKIDQLQKELKEKEDGVLYLESLNHTLTNKELMSNQELQDARKEAVNGLRDILNKRTTLAIKRMGELDHRAFQELCSFKFSNEDWEEIAAKMCSKWVENVQNPHWHPFKKEIVQGQLLEIINDDDEKLKGLRDEFGELVYKAVTNALLELNEYNASGRYPTPVVWNVKEDRRASIKEIIEYIIKQLKSHKRKRRI